MADFTIYSSGLVYCSVCSSLTLEETTARLNTEQPTGIASPWALADEPFKGGEPNPCPCNSNPETHKHYLFVC